jgi:hypothetical protein
VASGQHDAGFGAAESALAEYERDVLVPRVPQDGCGAAALAEDRAYMVAEQQHKDSDQGPLSHMDCHSHLLRYTPQRLPVVHSWDTTHRTGRSAVLRSRLEAFER